MQEISRHGSEGVDGTAAATGCCCVVRGIDNSQPTTKKKRGVNDLSPYKKNRFGNPFSLEEYGLPDKPTSPLTLSGVILLSITTSEEGSFRHRLHDSEFSQLLSEL